MKNNILIGLLVLVALLVVALLFVMVKNDSSKIGRYTNFKMQKYHYPDNDYGTTGYILDSKTGELYITAVGQMGEKYLRKISEPINSINNKNNTGPKEK